MESRQTSQESEEELAQVKLILVVEDDTAIGEILVHAIESETSYQVVCVFDSFQALKVVNDIKPHLLLLDYHLPRLNGLELYDQLCAKESFEQVPVLFMSADAPKKELEERHIPFIEKPFKLDEVLQTIASILG